MMDKLEGKVLYSSLSKIDKQIPHSNLVDDDDYNSNSEWAVPRIPVSYPSASNSPKQESILQFPREPENFADYDEYDSSKDADNLALANMAPRPPEVNLKNVMHGIVAILTGKNKSPNLPSIKPSSPPSSNASLFLDPAKNGDDNNDPCLHPSVYIPSAPPMMFELSGGGEGISYNGYKEVLEAEPPEWLPDSAAAACLQCGSQFTAVTRGRHHCRFCGGIFCRMCTKGRCLLPVRFRERNPQRVCDACYDRLDPLQGVLINSVSNAAQSAKHDVVDWTCTRGWLNLPLGMSMEHEIYKACNTLRSYSQILRLNSERTIPLAVLKGARGLAILTVAKAGVVLSYKLGTGLVIARRLDGTWSAPSAISSVGLGWGAQIGGELMDFIVILHNSKAVKTFCSRMHFSLGAGCSAAAGPIGRIAEADLRAGDRGSGMCYTYSCTKGAFVGVSLEGNVVTTRMDTNLRFYGDPYLTTADILLGAVDRPKAAEPLYTALEYLYASLRN